MKNRMENRPGNKAHPFLLTIVILHVNLFGQVVLVNLLHIHTAHRERWEVVHRVTAKTLNLLF